MKITYNLLLGISGWLLVVLLCLCRPLTVEAKSLPFENGEKLEFSLRWLGFVGGKSVIEVEVSEEVKENPQENPTRSYLLKANMRTVGLADILFGVKNEFASLIRFEGGELIPQWWEVSEKGRGSQSHKKTYYSTEEKQKGFQNPLSALFFLRTKDLKCGETFNIPVRTGGKTHEVMVEVFSREELKIHRERFDTIIVRISVGERDVKTSSVNIQNLKIWLTSDHRKLPILIKAYTSIGPITAVLDNRREFF